MKELPGRARSSRCELCAAEFTCGASDPCGCWCADLPKLPASALKTGKDCLCEACLRSLIEQQAGAAAPRSSER
jgi:hypothetical protein